MRAIISDNMREVEFDQWMSELFLGRIGKTGQCDETEYQVTIRGDLVRSAERKTTEHKGPFRGEIDKEFLKSTECKLYIVD